MNSMFSNTEQKGTIVDVRTAEEFMEGHVSGSYNIPLQQIRSKLAEIKSMKHPNILCCASGNRSAQAHGYLSMEGVLCLNGGSRLAVNYSQSQNV